MARLLLRPIISKNRQKLFDNIYQITERELKKSSVPLKKKLIKQFDAIVKNWEKDVKFKGRVLINNKFIAIDVFPTGSDKEIWGYVDKGTKPHPIRAKTRKGLRFKSKYRPKTLAKPARTDAGGGTSSGPWVVKQEVNHPGIKARNFEKVIAEDYKPFFRKEVENSFRRISRIINAN